MILHDLFLTEADWYERSPLTKILEQNRGKWIHFSQVPKLGVNPKKFHTDPHGVYFYPVDWLLSRTDRILRGDQYGLNMPYYFIVDLDLTAPGVVLGKITGEEAAELGIRNGWLSEEQAEPFRAATKPGMFLWNSLKRMVEKKEVTWGKALKGLSYVLDDGGGLILSYEPSQIVVFDAKIIRNVNGGKNVNVSAIQNGNGPHIHTFKEVIVSLIEGLQKTYGGDVKWKEINDLRPYQQGKKMRAPSLPSITFPVNGKLVTVEGKASRSFGISMYLSYVNGREKQSVAIINEEKLNKLSVPEMLELFRQKLDEIAGLDTDLRFDPFMSEEKAHIFMQSLVNPGANLHLTNEIDNDYKSMVVEGVHRFQAAKTTITTKMVMRISENHFTFNAYILSEKGPLFYLSNSGMENFTDTSAVEANLVKLFQDTINSRYKIFGPEGYSFPKFYGDEWSPFVGWLVLNCGLSLGGKLQKIYTKQVEQYKSMSAEDRDYLVERIGKVLGERR